MQVRVPGLSVLSRRHGPCRCRVIGSRGFCSSEVSLDDAEVAVPVREFPVYKRRSFPGSPHFKKVDLMVKQLDYAVDSSDYARVLQRCKCPKALRAGRRVHKHLVSRGRGEDVYLNNMLIQMYGNCRSLKDCYLVFQEMQNRNVFTWSMLISASALNEKSLEALGLYREMLQDGFQPTERIFMTLVSVCANVGAVAEGELVHSHIRELNFNESFTGVTNSLIKMYGKFRLLKEAVKQFDRMSCRDVTSYSAMITAYAKCSQPKNALLCFRRMWSKRIKPSVVIFTRVLGVCGELGDFESGLRVHLIINIVGFSLTRPLKVALFDMYSRCGEVVLARQMFDSLNRADVTSWNLMMATYARKGLYRKAAELADDMKAAGLKPNANTFISRLGKTNNLDEILKVHSQMQKSRITEGAVNFNNALITKLGRLGSVGHAREVLNEMPEKNLVSWTAMISAYTQNGWLKEGLQLLQYMDLEGVKPNNVTFTSLMDACYDEKDARSMHSRICSSDEADQRDYLLHNAMLKMLIKSGNIVEAKETFEVLETKDVITWTTMIGAVPEEARKLFQRMELEGVKPTSVTFLNLVDACSSLVALESSHQRILEEGYRGHSLLSTALVRGYSKYKQVDKARACFNEMETKDVFAWTAVMTGYAEQHQNNEALLLYQQMQLEGVKPSSVTLSVMLKACGTTEQGRKIRESVLVAGSELVNVCGLCGSAEDVKAAFDRMSQPGVAEWTTLVTAFAKAGRGREAVKHLRYMEVEGLKPNNVTMRTVLAACSCLGSMQNEAWELLSYMKWECGIELSLEHYGYMFDMLGRAGQLEQARTLIEKVGVSGDKGIWMIVLKACRMHKEWRLGSEAGERLIKLEPMDPGAYMMLASMHADAKNRDKEVQVLARMEYRGLKPCGYKYQFT